MKKETFIIFLAIFLFSISASVYGNGSACSDCPEPGGLVPCGRTCNDPSTPGNECEPCTLCHLFVMVKNVLDFLLFKIVPVLAALMIAIGGFMYIFALGLGKPEMISQANRLFAAVAIGLLIIYGAWVIVNTFFMLIGVADWTGLKNGWWQIDCSTTPP